MRTITEEIKNAFESKKSRTISNTRTDGQSVWLHGNKIIERRPDGVYATLAGWNTPTTRERVNGITGARFHQKNHIAHLNGTEVCPKEWVKVLPNN